MRVTVQYREPHGWKTAFVGRVLYHDQNIILVRGAGSHSVFGGEGWYSSVGLKNDHPAKLRLPRRTKGYRLHPKSVERLKALRAR